jgi:hypothetical protein
MAGRPAAALAGGPGFSRIQQGLQIAVAETVDREISMLDGG